MANEPTKRSVSTCFLDVRARGSVCKELEIPQSNELSGRYQLESVKIITWLAVSI